MIPELLEFLIRERAPFEVIDHGDVATVQVPATSRRALSRRVARVVILRDGEWYALAVLPETARLDLTELRRGTGRHALAFAMADDLRRQFPYFAIDPLSPFGRMFGLPVYLDRAFAEEAEMIFESGTHRERVSMPMGEYVRVERPAILPLARAPRAA
jgi:Ala-tRNA(Pro) deacylase